MARIAVIGSGIAGLASAWYLGGEHEVTLIEKQATMGMAARGLEYGGARVDMPLRVLYRGYYPTLTSLYADADIEITAADYSASFSDLGGSAYFRYQNWQPLARVSIPMLRGGQPLGQRSRRIVADLFKLYRRAARDARRLRGSAQTLDSYLQQAGYSREFAEAFLLPVFAAIGTCRTDSVRDYPARVVIDYLRQGVLLEGVSRTVLGADNVVAVLSSRCHEILTGTGVSAIEMGSDGIHLASDKGRVGKFDHVVLATQGNQALRLVEGIDAEAAAVLARFQYEPSEVLVHTDRRLMPSRRRDWSPVNFFVDDNADRPMASIWLNRVLPVAGEAEDAFQTWNPLLAPAPDSVLARARFERPVVDAASSEALQTLQTLQQQSGRRLWFAGSYAEAGVPLLESAARSALAVSERIRRAPR